MNDLLKAILKRDETARAALRYAGNVDKMIRKARKIALEVRKLGGPVHKTGASGPGVKKGR